MYDFLLEISWHVRAFGGFMWQWLFLWVLLGGGVYFTIKFKLVQFTLIGDAVRLLWGKDKQASLEAAGKSRPKHALSAFQAFWISESSRVGTGNLVGTAVAITMGGPGAIFWMWVTALFGAATCFVECTLGQLHKKNVGDRFMGGPMYYAQRAFKSKFPAILIAIVIAICYSFVFNSIQTNTIVDNLGAFVPHRIIIGIICAILFSLIVWGGIKRIADAAVAIMPFTVAILLICGFILILLNLGQFFATMGYIVQSAFGLREAASGLVGFTIAQAVQQGVRRGVFSNEAGQGTVPIAASTSVSSHPVKMGITQSFGVLLDTWIICSVTAFLILMSGTHITTDFAGVALVNAGFAYYLGGFARPFLAVVLFLLPFTSVVGNYFYGETCMRFATKKQSSILIYRALATGLIILASMAPLQLVWNLGDIFTGTMVTINMVVLFTLRHQAYDAYKDYMRQRQAQKAGTGGEPIFHEDLINVETDYWKRDRANG